MFPIYHIADTIHVAPSSVGNKILEVFRKKSGSVKLSKLYSLIPKVFDKLILKSRKSRKMAKIQDNILTRVMAAADELKMAPEVRGRAIRILRSNLSTLAMTTPDVAAGVCLNMSVLSLQRILDYRIRSIARILSVSSSAITACAYRVMRAHGFVCDFRIYELEERVPHFYERIVGELPAKKDKSKARAKVHNSRKMRKSIKKIRTERSTTITIMN